MVPLHPSSSPTCGAVDTPAARVGQRGSESVSESTGQRQAWVQHVISQIPKTELGVLAHRAKPVRHGRRPATFGAVSGKTGQGAAGSDSAKAHGRGCPLVEVLFTATQLHGLLVPQGGRKGVKGHHVDPGLVAVTPGHHAALCERPDGDQVIFSACGQVLPIRAPGHTEQPTKITLHHPLKLHGVKVEDAQAAILAYTCHVHSIWGEGKLIETSLAHGPAEQWVAWRLGFAGVDGEAFALAQQGVLWRGGATWMVHIVKVEVATGM